MRETADEIEAIQQLLDKSYRHAGNHLRAVLPAEKRVSARELCHLLRGVCVLDLATANTKGHPLVAPVDGLFYHGRFYFGSAHNSIRFKHIRRQPRVSAAYTLGIQLSVLVHGKAIEIDVNKGDYEDLHSYFREVYGKDYDDWGYWGNNPLAVIEPHQMFATLFDRKLLDA